MNELILIYAKYDLNKSIVDIKSSIFLSDTIGYTQIDSYELDDEDTRYMFAHADNGEYIMKKHGKPLFDENGRPNYHDSFIEWTVAEKDKFYPITPSQPTELEKLKEENVLLKAQVKSLSDRSDFIDDCIAEMATIVYA